MADIGAYATSSEALLSVLTDGDLVTWGRRQEFQRMLERCRYQCGIMNLPLKLIRVTLISSGEIISLDDCSNTPRLNVHELNCDEKGPLGYQNHFRVMHTV